MRINQDNIEIEEQIYKLVHSVKPNPQFVNQLKQKLVANRKGYGKAERSVRWVLVSCGLLLGLLFLILYRNQRSHVNNVN